MTRLDYDDIQGITLQERPKMYKGIYLLLSIDNSNSGQDLLKNLAPEITSAGHWDHPSQGAWINVGITYAGLKKIGVPEKSLSSFSSEFKAGMASRAEKIGDFGESAPVNWEAPFRTDDLHLTIAIFAPDQEMLIEALGREKSVYHQLEGISLLYELEIASSENGRTQMGSAILL